MKSLHQGIKKLSNGQENINNFNKKVRMNWWKSNRTLKIESFISRKLLNKRLKSSMKIVYPLAKNIKRLSAVRYRFILGIEEVR